MTTPSRPPDAPLTAKAQEVVNGHKKQMDGVCRECNMTWPCHAWLLADEILRTDRDRAARGASVYAEEAPTEAEAERRDAVLDQAARGGEVDWRNFTITETAARGGECHCSCYGCKAASHE